MLVPFDPRDPLSLDSIPGTLHPAREVAKNHPIVPQGKIVDLPSASAGIVGWPFPSTQRTFGPTPFPRANLYHKRWILEGTFSKAHIAEDKALEPLNLIEYSFDEHCSSFKWFVFLVKTYLPLKRLLQNS
jgi:hypothetical protein